MSCLSSSCLGKNYYYATQFKQFKDPLQTQLATTEREMIIHLVKLSGRNAAYASHRVLGGKMNM